MRYKQLGKSGIEASIIILGTWATSGWMWGGTDEKEAINAIHATLDNGVNAIDTAPIYGFGRSEQLVGKALKGRRDDVVIASKCGLIWHDNKGALSFNADDYGMVDNGTGKKIYSYLGPESIRYEIEKSLIRLRTDYIDLYQVHWQDPTTQISDTMNELLKLKQDGKIRAIGVCNASVEEMKQYNEIGTLDTDQEKYSLLDRKAATNNIPYALSNDMAFLGYSPLSYGLLTGNSKSMRKYGKGDIRLTRRRFSQENIALINTMLNEFKPIADEHDVTITQLVIAWVLNQKGCSHVLVGARKTMHAIENIKGGDLLLSQGELDQMQTILEKYLPDLA
ncbi:MAG: aldo/keto reductase [Candidatus Scalindua sp.]